MAELIVKDALIADFNNSGIHIEFDLPVEEILGEDVDIDDFTTLVQDAIQAYRKMVIGTIQKQPTTTEAEIRAKAISDTVRKLYDLCYLQTWVKEKDLEQLAEQLKEEQ